MPASRILPLARTSRCAIVGSGTRNARAISAVVNPPSSRSVSATRAGRASAGWQHVKISRSRSSPTGSGSVGSWRREQPRGLGLAGVPGRFAAGLVDGAVAGRGDDPAGRAGRQAGLRPAADRGGEGVLDRVLGGLDVAEDADQDSDGPAVLRAEDLLDLRGGRRAHNRHDASRTRPDGRPARPGRGGPRSAAGWRGRAWRPQASASSRSAAASTVRPPTCSLPSTYGPSVVTISVAVEPDHGRRARRVQAAREDPGARGPHLLVDGLDVLHDRFDHLGRRRGAVARLLDRQQVVPHQGRPPSRAGVRAGPSTPTRTGSRRIDTARYSNTMPMIWARW